MLVKKSVHRHSGNQALGLSNGRGVRVPVSPSGRLRLPPEFLAVLGLEGGGEACLETSKEGVVMLSSARLRRLALRGKYVLKVRGSVPAESLEPEPADAPESPPVSDAATRNSGGAL
jgi:hypothetical protein